MNKRICFVGVVALGLAVASAAVASTHTNCLWWQGVSWNGTGSGAMTIDGVKVVGGQLVQR
jgi:hypothetical protein